MQIAFALIVIFWWVAIWGLIDLMVEDWSRKQRFMLYVAMIAIILVTMWIFPDFVHRL
jgi:hypothetical protein